MRKYFWIFSGGLCFCVVLYFGYVFALDNSTSSEISSDNSTVMTSQTGDGCSHTVSLILITDPAENPTPYTSRLAAQFNPPLHDDDNKNATWKIYRDGALLTSNTTVITSVTVPSSEDSPAGNYTVELNTAYGSVSYGPILYTRFVSITSQDPYVVSTGSNYYGYDAETVYLAPDDDGETILIANNTPAGTPWGDYTPIWSHSLDSDQFEYIGRIGSTDRASGMKIFNNTLTPGLTYGFQAGSVGYRVIKVKMENPRVDSLTLTANGKSKTVNCSSEDGLNSENAAYVLQGTPFSIAANHWPASQSFPENFPTWNGVAWYNLVDGRDGGTGSPLRVLGTLYPRAHDISASYNGTRYIRVIVTDQLVKSISGGGKTSSRDPDETITESETIYIHRGTPLTLTVAPDPTNSTFPSGKPAWTADGLTSHLSATTGASITINNQAPAGTYLVKASHNNTKVIKVVIAEVGIKKITGDGKTSEKAPTDTLTDNETIYILQGTELTLEATPDPAMLNFPSGKPTWSGIASSYLSATSGSSITISDEAPSGEYIVSATCNNTKTIKVVIADVFIESISGESKTSTKADPEELGDGETIYILQGTELALEATPNPSTSNFPSGNPTWDGIASSYLSATSSASITINDQAPSGEYIISASCNNTKVIKVVIADVLLESISGGNKTSTKETLEELDEEETIYLAQGTPLTLVATPDPSTAEFPEDNPTWTADELFYYFNTTTGESITVSGEAPPGEYIISATCGNTKVIKLVIYDLISVSGGGKTSTRGSTPTGSEEWTDAETIYAQPCSVINLSALLAPSSISTGDYEYDSLAELMSWSVSGTGTLVKDEDNGFEAEFKPGSPIEEYIVTAACGASQRVIRVKVVEPKIHSVTFTEKVNITKDNGTAYSGEHWKDDDLDGTSDLTNANADATKPYQPVAYVSTDKMKATPVFKPNSLKSAPADNKDFVVAYDVEAAVKKARFAPPQTGTTFDWSDSVNFSLSGITLTAKNSFNTSAKVEYKNTYALTWDVGFGESGTPDGDLVWYTSTSEHELYLTYKAAAPGVTPYETVLHIGCTNADGKTTESDIVAAVWAEFTDLEVKKKGATSTLKYYGAGYSTGNFFQTVQLLSNGDGRCGAWERFFIDIFTAQGITSELQGVFVSSPSDGFLVKNWTFIAPSPSAPNGTYPYFVHKSAAPYASGTCPGNGISGQGPTARPKSEFSDHGVVKINSNIYDPSYGVSYTSANFLADFKTNVLDGFYITISTEEWATSSKTNSISLSTVPY